MKILYHHRTRATDAQRIHIVEIMRAFAALGHEVREAALVSSATEVENAARDAAEARWKTAARRIPFLYELVQLAYNLYGVPRLLWEMLRFRPGFLYERYSLWNFAGVLAGRLAGVPVTLEVNSPFALEQARDGEIRAVRLAAWSERAICNLAQKVVVVSTPLKHILAAAGIAAARIEVMTNGVDRDAFRPQPPDPALRRSLGLEGKLVVGFVGWFRDWHRIDLLLEAFHRAGLRERNAALLLVGEGPAMAGLQAYTARYGLGGAVVFTGPLAHARVPAHLNLLDVAVQPAANEYCCPMKILEYAAAGKPVVAPRQANIVEILDEGEEALFFTPGDADSLAACLALLAADATLRARLAAGAAGAIERRGYTWTANARRVVSLMRPLAR